MFFVVKCSRGTFKCDFFGWFDGFWAESEVGLWAVFFDEIQWISGLPRICRIIMSLSLSLYVFSEFGILSLNFLKLWWLMSIWFTLFGRFRFQNFHLIHYSVFQFLGKSLIDLFYIFGAESTSLLKYAGIIPWLLSEKNLTRVIGFLLA